MTDLSPDAQAVLNAVVDGAHPAFAPIAAPMAAAALRAAADQVVPEPPTWEIGVLSAADREVEIRRHILAIAAELEGIND